MSITLPSGSSLPLQSLSYFCFSSKSIIRYRSQDIFHGTINPRRICSAFIPHDQSNSNPGSVVGSVIFSISSCASVSCCWAIHARVIKSFNYNDGFIGDRLVSLYSKLGCVEDAHKLFDEMPNRDLVSWNSLISGNSRKGYVDKCLNAFCRMRSETDMQPNEVSLISIISACTDKGALDEGKYIHGFAVKGGLLSEAKVVNSLINMYGKFGYLDAACQLFEAMPMCNVVSWNSMVAIHSQNGFSD
ncbi:hypothetical protein L1049_026615 [Liquidambar formosana]|uniref:Pentatricopeptide repeat-containing protein n=1 Tax=Liquidambar formosana TaxID=63359 RepID=A0AAP0NF98_LIQFO